MRKKRFHIQPMAIVLLLWMLLTDRGGIALMTLAAAIFHEGGHVVAALLMRIPLRELRLDLLGARLDVSGRLLSYGEEWLLCAAGPAMSLLLSAAVAPLWHLSAYAAIFSCASLILGILNLLPIRTFDGGRMLESGLLFFLPQSVVQLLVRLSSFFFLFLLWAVAVYFLLRVGDGLSLFCFSMSLFNRFFDQRAEI